MYDQYNNLAKAIVIEACEDYIFKYSTAKSECADTGRAYQKFLAAFCTGDPTGTDRF